MAPWHPCFDVRVSHNVRMAPAYDFKLALTRLIEPTGGPGIELGTLEDVRWSNKTMAPGATALGFRGRVAAEGGANQRGIGYRESDGADGARVAG